MTNEEHPQLDDLSLQIVFTRGISVHLSLLRESTDGLLCRKLLSGQLNNVFGSVVLLFWIGAEVVVSTSCNPIKVC